MKQYTLKPLSRDISDQLPEEFASSLNPPQREAAFHDDGPLLVIAGAGSGKTKTLVHRVARLVASGIPAQQILLLTFTRKAADEMLRRASDLLDHRCQDVSGGTFHSFANIILRKYGSHIGYNNQFTILDRSDSEDLINVIRKELGMAKTDKRFPKKSTIANVIGKALNTEKPIEEILINEYPQFVDFCSEIEGIAEKYIQYKKTMQVMDYDDLLIQLLRLLNSSEEVRTKLQSFYKYILVDEYQDTNRVQAAILQRLVNEEGNIMVVGDDSQSIYSFRGANFRNIMQFPELFDGAKIVRLEQNYRSVQPILDLTNAMINNAREKFTKTLFTDRTDGVKPVYVETDNETQQSQFVAQKILELREEGVPLSSMAVLIRSGWHSNDLEVQFKSSNIPFQKFGGFKFMETSHVKDMVCYLKLMANPRDTVSWSRVLLLLAGVGPKAATDIAKAVNANPQAPIDGLEPFKKKAFFNDVYSLCKLIFEQEEGRKVVDVLKDVMAFYKPYFMTKYDDYTKREKDLDSLEGIAERYDNLGEFLTEMTLEPPDASQEGSIAESMDDEKLTISTIHSAKGLEWKVVFMLSAVDGFIPSFQSLGDASQIEEERRLMYVALTRAEDQLFIIKPNMDMSPGNYYRHTGMSFSQPSRFLTEGNLINSYTEKWSLVPEKRTSKFSSYYDSMYGGKQRRADVGGQDDFGDEGSSSGGGRFKDNHDDWASTSKYRF